MSEYIDVVMTELPGPYSQFVETEDSKGRGVRLGNWVMREDGCPVLRTTREDLDFALTQHPNMSDQD